MSGVSASKPPSKSRASGFLRIGVSIAILALLLSVAPIDNLFERITTVSPFVWLIAFAGFLCGHMLAAAKWRWVIGGGMAYSQALRAHFAGLAANIALPGVAGGDLVRAGLVMSGSTRKTALAVGSLADRLIDTAVLVVIAAIGAIWLGVRANVSPVGLTIAALATIGAGLAGVILLRPLASLIRRRAPSGKIGAVIGDVADAMDEMASRRSVLFGCIALSFAIQFSFALLNGLLARDIGAQTSFAAWVFAWPLAKLIATLPISFGGLGVREASIAGLMTPMGYEAAGVIAASLIWQSILYAGGIVGALAQSLALGKETRKAKIGHG